MRDAILETAAALAAQLGLRAVTMSHIAEKTGIGRATLYKYFSSVEQILIAWHERQVAEHLAQLTRLGDQPGEPGARLAAVLEAYALISFQRHRHAPELGALVHQREHMAGPEQHLLGIVRRSLADAVAVGAVRADVSTDELATFCLHALAGAGSMGSKTAVRRLVGVVVDALKPQS